MKHNKIFVSIASYKESELKHTVDTLIQRATYSDNLRVVVCQQDDPTKFVNFSYSVVESIDVNYITSRGCCWARRQIQDRYNNEEYFLQIDAHCVMVQDWDSIIIDQIKRAKKISSNPVVLAAYPAGYFIQGGRRKFNEMCYQQTTIKNDPLDLYGIWLTGHPNAIPQTLIEPVSTPFINAGLMFGDGSFMNDCLYDPDIYYDGEELLNTVKAFTNGYDLFNPNAHICWHLYKDPNLNDRGIWTYHFESAEDEKRKIKVNDLKNQATIKLKKILSGQLPNELGSVRTIADYENYIGRSIMKKGIFIL